MDEERYQIDETYRKRCDAMKKARDSKQMSQAKTPEERQAVRRAYNLRAKLRRETKVAQEIHAQQIRHQVRQQSRVAEVPEDHRTKPPTREDIYAMLRDAK